MAKRAQTVYTPEEIDRGLLALAVTGTAAAASRQLALNDPPVKVDRRTIAGWRERYPDRWRDIQTNHAARVEETIINEARETAIRAAELERETLSLELERTKNKEVKDAGASARNASTVKGINIDKVLGLSGRPRVVVEHRQAEDIIASLRRLAPKVFSANGEAEEVGSLPQLPEVEA